MTIAISPSYTQKYLSWTDWKAIQSAKSLVYQHDDNTSLYVIYGYDGPEAYICQIYKGLIPYTLTTYSQAQNDIDKSDFETNFLPNSNKTIKLPESIRGATDGTSIGNVTNRLKVIDEDAISILTLIAAGLGAAAPSIFKKNEVAVTTRTEFDLPNTTYTVPANKKFLVTSFSASYDAQASLYVRLKKQTGGTGEFETQLRLNMMSGGQGNSTISLDLSSGMNMGAAGDVFKITIEASIAKGTIWAEYSGSEI